MYAFQMSWKLSLLASKDACHNKLEHTLLKWLPRLLLPTSVCVKSHAVKQILSKKSQANGQVQVCCYNGTQLSEHTLLLKACTCGCHRLPAIQCKPTYVTLNTKKP